MLRQIEHVDAHNYIYPARGGDLGGTGHGRIHRLRRGHPHSTPTPPRIPVERLAMETCAVVGAVTAPRSSESRLFTLLVYSVDNLEH